MESLGFQIPYKMSTLKDQNPPMKIRSLHYKTVGTLIAPRMYLLTSNVGARFYSTLHYKILANFHLIY